MKRLKNLIRNLMTNRKCNGIRGSRIIDVELQKYNIGDTFAIQSKEVGLKPKLETKISSSLVLKGLLKRVAQTQA